MDISLKDSKIRVEFEDGGFITSQSVEAFLLYALLLKLNNVIKEK